MVLRNSPEKNGGVSKYELAWLRCPFLSVQIESFDSSPDAACVLSAGALKGLAGSVKLLTQSIFD